MNIWSFECLPTAHSFSQRMRSDWPLMHCVSDDSLRDEIFCTSTIWHAFGALLILKMYNVPMYCMLTCRRRAHRGYQRIEFENSNIFEYSNEQVDEWGIFECSKTAHSLTTLVCWQLKKSCCVLSLFWALAAAACGAATASPNLLLEQGRGKPTSSTTPCLKCNFIRKKIVKKYCQNHNFTCGEAMQVNGS